MTTPADLEGDVAGVVEPLALRAWPPAESVAAGPWRCRYTPGCASRRLNSVWTFPDPWPADADRHIDACERFYAAHGVSTQFQIGPDESSRKLDAALEARGYAHEIDVAVYTADLASVGAALSGAADRVTCDAFDRPLPEWMDCFHRIGDRSTDDRAVLQAAFERIEPTAIYALARAGREPVGVAVAVAETGWVGLFSFATANSHRRLGVGTAMARLIVERARSLGASSLYLQVRKDNDRAVAFYRRWGFAEAYTYHYRIH